MSISIEFTAGASWLARLAIADGRLEDAVLAIESALRDAPVAGKTQSLAVYEAADGSELWLHEVGPGSPAGQAATGSPPQLLPVALRACSATAAGKPAVLTLAPVRETAGGPAAAPVVVPAGTAEKLVIWCRLAAAGSLDDLLSALEPLMRAFDSDHGTEIFTLYVSGDDPGAVWMHEVYTDRAAFAEHGRTRSAMDGREAAEAALRAALGAPPDNTYVRARLQHRPGCPLTLAPRRADEG